MSQTQPRPGSIVTTRVAPPPRTAPVDTGVWFVTGLADRGPTNGPVLVQNLQDFINSFGARQTYSVLYDAIETYFREGGAQAYVSRVVGPAPVTASVNLLDAGAGVSLVASAKLGPGAWANTLRIAVATGSVAGSFTITVSDTVLGQLEVSPDLMTQADAVAWSQQSQYLTLALGASALNPANIAAAALTGGNDDRNNVTETQWTAALSRFAKDLGPGQISAPGRNTTAAHAALLAHASVNNRYALLDAPDSPTIATVQAAASAQRGTNDTYGSLFAPWLVVPGVLPGTTRIVPPSAGVAARIANNEGSGASPNTPAAGQPEGVFAWVIGLSQPAYDSGAGQAITRDSMYSAGVNQIAFRFGQYMVFGWRTLTSENGANQAWLSAGNARLRMAITARALFLAENYILDEINPIKLGRFNGDLQGMLVAYWPNSLYGDTPEDAFVVDTGPNVNTPVSINNREVHAAIACRMSPNSELVVIDITKVPVTQSL